ncbi:hypothetical protein [Silvibacterium acidisoli]|uniref:hypothetical protein n=1 Tax=Acidobacteriaceae bacterium ZG23-2 TaxID=2883246 RepID=UPI00406CC4C6
MFLEPPSSGFSFAWRTTQVFWLATVAALERHPLPLFTCAAIPAAIRAYLLLHTRPIHRWQLNAIDALLVGARVMLCVIAVWVALPTNEWDELKRYVMQPTAFEIALQRIGAYLGRSLHVFFWEALFFVAAFLLLNWLLSSIARPLSKSKTAMRSHVTHRAVSSILRNLLLVPAALVYLVEILRLRFF